ncbi:MAG: hypothetical protein GEV06_11515 [Luteitalea sp.]|nr:hypothetical protein [Luteitalea sp.]
MRAHFFMTRAAAILLFVSCLGTPALGQETKPQRRAGFSLASSEIFNTRERAQVWLTFQEVDHLDFRIYRVKDPIAFFEGLRDPHVLGSPEPVVPQEETWLERIARWKAARRQELRDFLRRQVSLEQRQARRARLDRAAVQQRQVLSYNAFAQVPLLNRERLVASWREQLPPVREAEYRHLPLDLPGAGVYVVEAVNPPLRAYTIVLVSDIGLVTKAAPGRFLTYAVNRFTGEPVPDCRVRLLAGQKPIAEGASNADGLFTASVGQIASDQVVAVAHCGSQAVATDPYAWNFRAPAAEPVAYVYTDRPIYRPGHEVHLKAILRSREGSQLQPFGSPEVELRVKDARDKVLLRSTRRVDAFGAIAADLTLPPSAALGYYTIAMTSGGEETYLGSFEVQEYRKPELEVTVDSSARFARQGTRVRATVRARYYFGQPVSGAPVKIVLHKSFYSSPLQWVDSADEADEEGGPVYGYGGEQIFATTAKLDARGEATVEVPLAVDDQASDYTATIEARVTDQSAQEVSGAGRTVATYGDFLIAATAGRFVFRPGTPASLRLRVVDYAGQPQVNLPVNVWLARHWYTYDDAAGRSEEREEVMAQGVVSTDASGRAVWNTRVPAEGGSYRLYASARSGDRIVKSSTWLWVPTTGEESTWDREQQLELIPDRKSYQPGDTARFVIRGADATGPMLVTKEGRTITWHRVSRLPAGALLEVPIEELDLGNTWVNMVFLKDDRVYQAERRVDVPPVTRGLQVTVTARAALSKPREPGVFTIRTLDSSGNPVPAQVSVGVVDEAVYGVKPDTTPDPLRVFYRNEYSRVGTQFSRNYSFIGYAGTRTLKLATRRRPLTLADFKAERPERPFVRKQFPDAIYWVADLMTDDTGTATVQVDYPDSLTTWRVTARAITTDTRAGTAVARATTTKDVILRIVPPRFLTEGDRVRVPTVAHSYLEGATKVNVSLQTKGLARDEGFVDTQSSILNQGGAQRHSWPLVAQRPGNATLLGSALTAGPDSDNVELTLPVLPYGLAREEGVSGLLHAETADRVSLAVPDRANPAARQIRVTLAPSLAGAMLGALDYLVSYPYACTEQTVSSFVPNLLVLRTLTDLQIAPTERAELVDRRSAEGLKRLVDLQNDEGGWGWWKTAESDPFMTAYALWALIEARRSGLAVDQSRLQRAADALAALYAAYPRAVPELKAYATYVLALGRGEGLEAAAFDQRAALETLWAARGRMSAYGRALLLLALDLAKDRRASTLARELLDTAITKGGLTWWTTEGDPLLGDSWIDTSVEATAWAVRALAPHAPKDPTLERAVRFLLASRTGGYWLSTKQTAMVLYGLLDYMRARREQPSTYSVDVMVNGQRAGQHTFTPSDWTSPDPIVVTAPAQEGANDIRLVRKGDGALYWSAAAHYYDTAEGLPATGTRKLAISRQYSLLAASSSDGKIVYRRQPFRGVAKPGDLVLVRLVVAGSRDWRHLMIEDPLPAGAEAVANPERYTLEPADEDEGRYDWFVGYRELRDTHVAAFLEQLHDGRQELTYLLRVVTPGEFRSMPARVAPMYQPGLFASTTAARVTVAEADETPEAAAKGGGN